MTAGSERGASGRGERLRALVVEDEPLVLMMIEDMLEELGVDVACSAATLAEALQHAEADIDFALLDINLKGEHSFSAAEMLRRRGKPFVFVTGYGAPGIQGAGIDAVVLQKPFTIADLRAALMRAVPDL